MPNVYVFITVIISSLIKGVTGFGFALISLPVLLIWYPAKEIIPVLMVCNLIASLMIVVQKKESKLIDKHKGGLITIGGIFTFLGVLVLKHLNAIFLVHISAIFFLVLTVLSLKKEKKTNFSIPGYFYYLAGALIGFLTGVMSISGPPLALFLNKARVTNQEFRETFAWFSVVTAAIAIVGYIHTHLLTIQTLKASIIFVPILLIGTIVGKKYNNILSVQKFKTINIALTILACILLIIEK